MILRSPLPDVDIPEIPLTEFVLERAEGLGARPALIDGPTGRTIRYQDLGPAIRSAAAGLAEQGFERGDVLAILSPNTPDYAIAFHAVARLGGVVTTVNPLYTADEVATQLGDAGARWLIAGSTVIDRATEAAKRCGIKHIWSFGEAKGVAPFEQLFATSQPPNGLINPRDDVVALPYSSGTTGLPKGVMLTHYNLVANVRQFEAFELIGPTDTAICFLPMYHIYGLTVIMNAGLRAGATIVTMPRFDLEQFLQMLQDHRVTFAFVVPPVALALAKHPAVDRYDLSSLRALFSGAAPLGPDLALTCATRLKCRVFQGYGMTELSPASHLTSAGASHNKSGSVGVCVPNTECKVVDVTTGAALGPKQEGEILVRGPQVMKGYLNRPDATAATVDSEGWLHTGDIGYFDDDGHFFVVDRLKELIKYKGFQVPPAELEAMLLSHSAVADAAVIPRPDEEAGEVPKAFVVLKSPATEAQLMAFVAERVAPHKKIRLLEFVDQIPKSPSGKILRRILIERDRKK